MSHNVKIISLFQDSCILLVCAMPLLVPFGLTRNIYLQSLVLVLTGCIAWIAIVYQAKSGQIKLPKRIILLLCVYILTIFFSTGARPSYQNLFGSPLVLLGALALLATTGCGLLLRSVEAKRLVSWLYVSIVALAITSVPYELVVHHRIGRLGGLLHHPDYLAVYMAVGLLLGTAMWAYYPKQHKLLIFGQASLLVVLFLTQTRGAIFVVSVVAVLLALRASLSLSMKILSVVLIVVLLGMGLVAFKVFVPSGRLTNSTYAAESVSYRMHLQYFGIKAAATEPYTGYGAGSVSDALPCQSLTSSDLQASCHQGFYFNSSHNVFLDRILALGWLGGLSFIALTVYGLWVGLRSAGKNSLLAFCLLAITLYYFTNPTNIEIELLFWIFLLRPYATPIKKITT